MSEKVTEKAGGKGNTSAIPAERWLVAGSLNTVSGNV